MDTINFEIEELYLISKIENTNSDFEDLELKTEENQIEDIQKGLFIVYAKSQFKADVAVTVKNFELII